MHTKLLLIVLASVALSFTVLAENIIELKPNDAKPTEVVIAPMKGSSLVFYRYIWQAMKVSAGDRGINLTDLLFYNTFMNGKPEGQNAYWTKPENWDSQLSFKLLGKNEAGGETVLIEGKRDGYAKQVYITAFPNENAVYVVNLLTAMQAGKYDDIKLAHFRTDPTHPDSVAELMIDGNALPLDKKCSGKSSAVFYFEKRNLTIGIFMAPLAMQKHKLGKRGAFFNFEPLQSAACQLKLYGVSNKDLKAGDVVALCYMICWDEGMKLEDYAALEKKMQSGDLNARFYKLK